MPTTDTNARDQNISMLNAIRAVGSAEYTSRIPQATRDNFESIGPLITSYSIVYNEFIDSLFNRIGMFLYGTPKANNRFARFNKGKLNYGTDIEEQFVDLVTGNQFNPLGPNPLARRKRDINVVWYKLNREMTYEATIQTIQMRKAVERGETLQFLQSSFVGVLSESNTHDQYLFTKELFALWGTKGGYSRYADYGVVPVTDEDTARAFMRTVRKAKNDMSFTTNFFNAAGVYRSTPPQNQILIINKDLDATIGTELMTYAFHNDQVAYNTQTIVIDGFSSMDTPDITTYALLIETDFPRIYSYSRSMESIRNPQGSFTNYFLHDHELYALSPFRNAIRFTTTDPTGATPMRAGLLNGGFVAADGENNILTAKDDEIVTTNTDLTTASAKRAAAKKAAEDAKQAAEEALAAAEKE